MMACLPRACSASSPSIQQIWYGRKKRGRSESRSMLIEGRIAGINQFRYWLGFKNEIRRLACVRERGLVAEPKGNAGICRPYGDRPERFRPCGRSNPDSKSGGWLGDAAPYRSFHTWYWAESHRP